MNLRVESRRAAPQDCHRNAAFAEFSRQFLGARAAPPAARFPDVPMSDVLAGFQIWAPGFDEITLQS